MGGSVADRQDPEIDAQPGNLVERTKILVENLQIRDVIGEQDMAARDLVRKRLGAIYAEHTEKGLVRSGATLKAGIEICEQQAVNLIASLVREVGALARNAAAFVLIEEALGQFLSFVEGELESIVKKVEYEIQDLTKSRGFSRAAERLWSERRTCVMERLERHRAEFVVPPELLRVVSLPQAEEPVDHGPVAAPAEPEPQPVAEVHSDPADKAKDEVSPVVKEAEVPPPVAKNEDAPVAAHGDEPSGPEPGGEPHASCQPAASPSMAGHWHDMWADIALQLYTGKLRPGSQAELGGAMESWFAAKGVGHEAAEVKKCAQRFWRKYAATQRIKSSIFRGTGDRPEEPGTARFDWLAGQPGPGSYSALAADEGQYLGIPRSVRYGASGPQQQADDASADGVHAGGELIRIGGRFNISGRSGPGIELSAPALEIE